MIFTKFSARCNNFTSDSSQHFHWSIICIIHMTFFQRSINPTMDFLPPRFAYRPLRQFLPLRFAVTVVVHNLLAIDSKIHWEYWGKRSSSHGAAFKIKSKLPCWRKSSPIFILQWTDILSEYMRAVGLRRVPGLAACLLAPTFLKTGCPDCR